MHKKLHDRDVDKAYVYRMAQKIDIFVLLNFTINRFLKLFHCQNQEKICSLIILSLKIPPQVCVCMCRYITIMS